MTETPTVLDDPTPVPVLEDPFEDDTPIVPMCSLENPETCESCQ